MKIRSFTVGPFEENTYLLVKEGYALLIDPGFSKHSEYQGFRQALEEEQAELVSILLTHAHIDHVLGLNQVLNSAEVPVYLNHSGDLYLWKNAEGQSAMFGIQSSGFSFTPEPLDEQTGFTAGPFTLDVIFTPGHSPDHVSLHFPQEQVLFAGDALFRESIGRTDLYEGSLPLLESSIREKLYRLPEETKVFPGHGPSTTIAHEKKHNGFVRP